ncbi:hypothetical protein L596_027135 [Steinernema carpocapsae]|nr:hypothetical protein L596_027135 [Steinernema carpocapsae]
MCSTILPKQVSLYSNAFAAVFDYIVPIALVIVLLTMFLGKISMRKPNPSQQNQWKINAYIVSHANPISP